MEDSTNTPPNTPPIDLEHVWQFAGQGLRSSDFNTAMVHFYRGELHRFTLTIESGAIGGMPAGGLSFGASVHPHAGGGQPAQFEF